MGLTDQSTPTQNSSVAPPPRLPGTGDRTVEPVTPPSFETRVNWLFSGVLLGAASWMLVLGIVFAAIGNLIIAGALFGGIALCGLAIWQVGRRRLAVARAASGRHRAPSGSAVA